MFKHRFSPYIVGACIVAFLSVSYVGYRAYQNHVEFKTFISDTQAFTRSIEGHPVHSSNDHTHGNEGLSVALKSDQIGEAVQAGSGEYDQHLTSDGEYVYEIAGQLISSDTPMNQQDREMIEWFQTGKMTPGVKEAIRANENLREDFKGQVVQRVVTPDGKLHRVIVPRDLQYEEGDAISQSELDPPMIEAAALAEKPWLKNKLIIDGVDYYPPKEYYSIMDSYERREYFNKFSWSIANGVSMAEVEKKVVQGELDFSLSESEKRRIDEIEATMERRRRLAPEALLLSDKPPVKVRFLPENEDMRPGWSRKNRGAPLKSWEADIEREESFFNEIGINESSGFPPVGSDMPRSSLDLPDMVQSTHSRLSKAGIEAPNKTPTSPTAKSIETQLRKQLSPERFSKVQQLINQYGSEEGLRRLRETDPEAARQLEREQHEPKTDTEP